MWHTKLLLPTIAALISAFVYYNFSTDAHNKGLEAAIKEVTGRPTEKKYFHIPDKDKLGLQLICFQGPYTLEDRFKHHTGKRETEFPHPPNPYSTIWHFYYENGTEKWAIAYNLLPHDSDKNVCINPKEFKIAIVCNDNCTFITEEN